RAMSSVCARVTPEVRSGGAIHVGSTAAKGKRVGCNETDRNCCEIGFEPSLVGESRAKGIVIEKRIEPCGAAACQKHAAPGTKQQRDVARKSGEQEEEGGYRV